jgi:hypothetical protein
MALAEGNATLETAVIQSEQGHTAKHCHKCLHKDWDRQLDHGVDDANHPCRNCVPQEDDLPTNFLRKDFENLMDSDTLACEAASPEHTFYPLNKTAVCTYCRRPDRAEYGWRRTEGGSRVCPVCIAKFEDAAARRHRDAEIASCLNCEYQRCATCTMLTDTEQLFVIQEPTTAGVEFARTCRCYARISDATPDHDLTDDVEGDLDPTVVGHLLCHLTPKS